MGVSRDGLSTGDGRGTAETRSLGAPGGADPGVLPRCPCRRVLCGFDRGRLGDRGDQGRGHTRTCAQGPGPQLFEGCRIAYRPATELRTPPDLRAPHLLPHEYSVVVPISM